MVDHIGHRVSVKTLQGESHEGVIFTLDPSMGVLVLEQRKAMEPKATYRVLRTSQVREIQVLERCEPPAEDAPEKLPLPEVNHAAVKQREERAIARAREDMGEMNKHVTVRAHAIFDAMRKTMPCQWFEKDDIHCIVVLGEVIVRPPYTPETCQGKGATLSRVQKVLAGELDKLARASS